VAIKIVSWNVEGRLGWVSTKGRGTPQQIVDHLLVQDADVIFLPEAYGQDVARGIDAQFIERGYQFYDVSYRDEGKSDTAGSDNPHSRFLSRLPVVRQESLRFGDVRTLQAIQVADPSTGQLICMLGIHFDDRTESQRLRQTEDVIIYLGQQKTQIVLMGDFNAMYGDAKIAGLLRARALRLGAWLFQRYFIGTVLVRIADMAKGTALSSLHKAFDLWTVNERHRATTTPKMRRTLWLPSVRLLEIDHILISSGLAAEGFTVDADGGSDHRLLSVVISVSDTVAIAKS
jgi:endonuclease/exonuclease/phosphatase family metal-dependent hydrolase